MPFSNLKGLKTFKIFVEYFLDDNELMIYNFFDKNSLNKATEFEKKNKSYNFMVIMKVIISITLIYSIKYILA